jgi:hypothetical protein
MYTKFIYENVVRDGLMGYVGLKQKFQNKVGFKEVWSRGGWDGRAM